MDPHFNLGLSTPSNRFALVVLLCCLVLLLLVRQPFQSQRTCPLLEHRQSDALRFAGQVRLLRSSPSNWLGLLHNLSLTSLPSLPLYLFTIYIMASIDSLKEGFGGNLGSPKKHFNQLKAYPLSNDDILEAIDLEPTNIFTSDKLNEAYSIDELLDRLGRGIMLFLTEDKNTGHWIGLLKQGDTIEVYDPYGFSPESFKKKLGAGNGLNPDMSILEELINRSGYKMIHNNQKNQAMSPDVATCGRHSIMRLMFRNLNNKQFNQFLKDIKKTEGISPDDLATGLTFELIGK